LTGGVVRHNKQIPISTPKKKNRCHRAALQNHTTPSGKKLVNLEAELHRAGNAGEKHITPRWQEVSELGDRTSHSTEPVDTEV